MDEEKFLSERMAQKSPFNVPEGYFDQLTERVMAQLPDDVQQSSRLAHLKVFRIWVAAAACLVVAFFSVTVFFTQSERATDESQQVASSESVLHDDDYMDAVADYAMIDNGDIYASLMEN